MSLQAWTDYPMTAEAFPGQGQDMPGREAPIRAVRVLSYDGDKYATIEVEGFEGRTSIKAGYLYSAPGRLGDVPHIALEALRSLAPSL